MITIRELLDEWTDIPHVTDVAFDVPDYEVWALARMAAIIAGSRAQEIGNSKYETACATFVKALGMPLKRKKL